MSKLISFTDLNKILRDSLTGKRYLHSLSVADTCVRLAKKFGMDETDARYVGLFHDAYRYIDEKEALTLCEENNVEINEVERNHPNILHGAVAAIRFPEVVGEMLPSYFKAIRHHTLASPDMGKLGAILFVSDYIEPRRTHLTKKEKREIFNLSTLEEMVIAILEREKEFCVTKQRKFAKPTEETLQYLLSGGKFE